MTINIKQVEMEQRCEKILSTLVKINSTHPKGNEMDMIKAILSFLKMIRYYTKSLIMGLIELL